MRYAAIALIVAGVLLGLFADSPLGFVGALVYLGPPIGLAVAFVVTRKYAPMPAFVAGSLVAVGAFTLIILSAVFVMFLSGNLAAEQNSDGLGATNVERFFLALFVLAITSPFLAFAGGIVSAIASLVGVRPDSQPHT